MAPAGITCERQQQVRYLPQPNVERLEASQSRFRGLPPPLALAYPVDLRKGNLTHPGDVVDYLPRIFITCINRHSI